MSYIHVKHGKTVHFNTKTLTTGIRTTIADRFRRKQDKIDVKEKSGKRENALLSTRQMAPKDGVQE